MYMETNKA